MERQVVTGCVSPSGKSGNRRFPKTLRLLDRREFVRLRHSRAIGNRYFVIAYDTGRTENTRLGITVSRKIGNAVMRNRIKRLVREQFRARRQSWRNPLDINVIARKGCTSATPEDIATALASLFGRLEG